MSKNYKLLVFDWDGTLMDSAGHIVDNMLRAIDTLGLPQRSPEQISELIGLSLQDAFQRLYGDLSAEYANQLLDQYRNGYIKQSQDTSMLFDGVEDALKHLGEIGYTLTVATGKSRVGLERSLKGTGLEQHFIMTRCADESASKPHPQMLFDILEHTGFDPADALMVGDTEYDMQMAAAAGMPALGVDCGVHSRERLFDSGALQVLDGVAQLPQWLTGSR
ncbi:MAG: HAD-IIIA family hydrolase [Salinisphaeraceae bacterium]|nr:HAD-IIIA family hydrolase [Salinisphaeraceae bacterium]